MQKKTTSPRSQAVRGLARSLSLPIAVAILLVIGGVMAPPPSDAPRARRARQEKAPIEVANAALAPRADAPSRERRLRYVWQPGTLFRYQFEFSQEVSIRMGAAFLAEMAKTGAQAPPAQGGDGRMAIRAELCVRVYEANGGEALVGYALESPSIDFALSGQATPPSAVEEMERRLSQEVLARVTERGEVRDLRFAADSTAKERNQMRSMLALLRIVLPEGTEKSWTTREVDALGTFEGLYAAGEPGADGAVRVTKSQRYLELNAAADNGDRKLVEEAPMEGEVLAVISSQAGVLVEAEGKVASELRGRDLAYECRTSIDASMRLAAVERGAVDLAGARRFGESSPGGLGCEGADEAQELAKRRAEAGAAKKLSLDQLLDALEQISLAGSFETQGQQVGLELVTLFRGDDGAVARALALVRAPRGRDGAVTSTIVAALGRAGTPAAQEALLAMVRGEEVSAELRHHAVLASALSDDPRPELLAGLDRQLDAGRGASDTTTLALLEGFGIAAVKRAERGDREGAEAMAARLEQELASSADPRRVRAALVGIGNAAQPRSLAAIEARLGDPEERVRIAAVNALRRMPPANARPLLERVERTDASEDVRAAAREAMPVE